MRYLSSRIWFSMLIRYKETILSMIFLTPREPGVLCDCSNRISASNQQPRISCMFLFACVNLICYSPCGD